MTCLVMSEIGQAAAIRPCGLAGRGGPAMRAVQAVPGALADSRRYFRFCTALAASTAGFGVALGFFNGPPAL